MKSDKVKKIESIIKRYEKDISNAGIDITSCWLGFSNKEADEAMLERWKLRLKQELENNQANG